jgi:hypothetical protein
MMRLAMAVKMKKVIMRMTWMLSLKMKQTWKMKKKHYLKMLTWGLQQHISCHIVLSLESLYTIKLKRVLVMVLPAILLMRYQALTVNSLLEMIAALKKMKKPKRYLGGSKNSRRSWVLVK